MNKIQSDLRDFHVKFSLTANDAPMVPSPKDMGLRANLINEEAREFDEATRELAQDPGSEEKLAALMKELSDILYVVFGAAVTYGVDLEAVFDETHRSNMTKVWPDGTVHRREEDGKVIKPPTYSKADIVGVLARLRAPKMVKNVKAAGKIEVMTKDGA